MVMLTDTSCYDGFAMRGVYQTMTGRLWRSRCTYGLEDHD